MDKFIGVKLIEAAPAHQDAVAGYAVRYQNGYESWSPKEPFDQAHQPVTAMSFGVALEMLRVGHAARRREWDESSYIYIHHKPGRVPERVLLMHVVWSGTEKIYHWVPTESELLACDWQLIEKTVN